MNCPPGHSKGKCEFSSICESVVLVYPFPPRKKWHIQHHELVYKQESYCSSKDVEHENIKGYLQALPQGSHQVSACSPWWRQSLGTSSAALTSYSSKLDLGAPAVTVQGREGCVITRMLFSKCFPPEDARKRDNWIFWLWKSSKSQQHSESHAWICWVSLQALSFCYLSSLQASSPEILSLYLPVKVISKLFNQANMQLINNNQFRK